MQIGKSCGVISPNRENVIIDELTSDCDPKDWLNKDILVSGTTITQILACGPPGKNKYMDALSKAEGLVVYRSSPAQKADIVKFARDSDKTKITLAIGDGANDVNMIEKAHVGVGIMGKEGN